MRILLHQLSTFSQFELTSRAAPDCNGRTVVAAAAAVVSAPGLEAGSPETAPAPTPAARYVAPGTKTPAPEAARSSAPAPPSGGENVGGGTVSIIVLRKKNVFLIISSQFGLRGQFTNDEQFVVERIRQNVASVLVGISALAIVGLHSCDVLAYKKQLFGITSVI